MFGGISVNSHRPEDGYTAPDASIVLGLTIRILSHEDKHFCCVTPFMVCASMAWRQNWKLQL